MLVVIADVHERASGVPEMLGAMGARVEVRALTRGDYIAGPETVVERKTVLDLHGSIAAGRFWHQMRQVRAAGRWPYLVVEGTSIFHGPMLANAVRGLCLAVSDLGVTIIRTEDADDTAAWLMTLAKRRRDGAISDRPVYAQRPKSAKVSPPEAAVACAPGVSVVTARTVLSHFGSLRSIADASIEDLQALPGVGIKRATAIAALIHDEWRTSNPS